MVPFGAVQGISRDRLSEKSAEHGRHGDPRLRRSDLQ